MKGYIFNYDYLNMFLWLQHLLAWLAVFVHTNIMKTSVDSIIGEYFPKHIYNTLG